MKIDVLQAFRGIAALTVLAWHSSILIVPGLQTGWQPLHPPSIMGVDLFFIISGVVMAVATTGDKGAVRFFLDRLTRIWPAYFIATLAAVAVMPEAEVRSFGVFLQSMVFYFSEITFYPPVLILPTLGVGWTLNYEMYFYVVFAASMLCGRWRWAALFGWFGLTVLVTALAHGN